MKYSLLTTACLVAFTASTVLPDEALARHHRGRQNSEISKQSSRQAPIVIVLPREGKTKMLADGYTLDSTGAIKNSSAETVALLNDKGVFTNASGVPFAKGMQVKLLGLMGFGLNFDTADKDVTAPKTASTASTSSAGAASGSGSTSSTKPSTSTSNTGSTSSVAPSSATSSGAVTSNSSGAASSGSASTVTAATPIAVGSTSSGKSTSMAASGGSTGSSSGSTSASSTPSSSAVDSSLRTSVKSGVSGVKETTDVAAPEDAGNTQQSATAPAASKPTAQYLAQFANNTGKPLGVEGNWTMTFADEFNDNSLDTNKWNDHIWYGDKGADGTVNYSVSNGALNIWPQLNNSGNFFDRTIDTDGKFSQKYGYFEARMKLPYGRGTWPAFWIFNHVSGAPSRPEIDIMEAYSGACSGCGWASDDLHPIQYSVTLWKDDGDENNRTSVGPMKTDTGDLSTSYHVYGLEWEQGGKIDAYFDGKLVQSAQFDGLDGNELYVLLDLWFGSASGTPNVSETPQGPTNAFQIDYVRVWQKE